jgi:hypothetical protein
VNDQMRNHGADHNTKIEFQVGAGAALAELYFKPKAAIAFA